MKPLFTDKVLTKENIIIIEGDTIYQDDTEVTKCFDEFFSNAVKNLNIEVNEDNLNLISHISDPIMHAIKKYENHPSIVKIKEVMENDIFSFSHVSLHDVQKEITLLNHTKASPKDTIPPKIIKDNCDILSEKLHYDFNQSIDISDFPGNLKNADVTPAHKKGA